jgi:hypothetical protein
VMTSSDARQAPIRILAPAEETGDLFARLISHFFLTQGYNPPRLNIHKTGREIDVEADHHFAYRRVVAECKATARPIGGDDINKFAGVLDAERRKANSKPAEGYFISLSGFTEAALEQELECVPPRMTLLDGQQIVEELVRGRIVTSFERALERAGHCAALVGPELLPEERPQLLAHKIGWVWAVHFQRNVEVTHVALIYADGEALASNLAQEIYEADRKARGSLHRLTYLSPEKPKEGEASRVAEARRRYLAYLAEQCGEFESLPADRDLDPRKWRLEDLLVPPHLEPLQKTMGTPDRLPAGQALKQRARLFVRSSAGGGKTTFLKWLAVAYAFPERREAMKNGLPDRDWFPLLLRCREIKQHATEPITSLLARLAERCEMAGILADAFQSLLHSVLHEGKALLLIDGLDEIGQAGDILGFVSQLRTFLSRYPGVAVVVTAREAGFRVVAGHLSSHCDHYRISDFDRNDIERFTSAWHREMIQDQRQAELQAESLAESIWESDQIRRLAVNPLLLMTLLQVQSGGGNLPRYSSMLYEKAIELLLEWNVQGFERLDVQDVTAQLAFLAWQMKEEGILRIPQKRLYKTLQAARKQMPEVLANAPVSVAEFVERVERSSLLVLSGRDTDNGRSVPFYEFRHSMFQDYLAAKALVEEYYPGRRGTGTLVSKLGPHLEDEAWKEVIPLVAGLAGSAAQSLIEALVSQVVFVKKSGVISCAVSLLARSLLEELHIQPALIERALDALARVQPGQLDPRLIHALAASHCGDEFCKLVWRGFMGGTTDLRALGWVVLVMGWREMGWPSRPDPNPERIREVEALLQQEEPRRRALGLLNVSWFASQLAPKPGEELRSDQAAVVAHLVPRVVYALQSPHLWEQFSGVFSLGWLFRAGAVPDRGSVAVEEILRELRGAAESEELRDEVDWSLGGLVSLLDQPGANLHDEA